MQYRRHRPVGYSETVLPDNEVKKVTDYHKTDSVITNHTFVMSRRTLEVLG